MKKKFFIAGGYLVFFLFSLVLSLYLTFDPQPIKKLARDYFEKKGWELKIEHISKYRLSGIRAQKIVLQKQNSSSKFQIDQLKLRLSIIPLMVGSLRVKLQALLYGGKLEGKIEKRKTKINTHLEIEKIDLARLTAGSSGLQIKSPLSGKAYLKLDNPANPRSWQGEMSFRLGAGEVSSFEYQGMEVPGIKVSEGKLELEINQGKAEIKTLELLSPDFPFKLKGGIELRIPLEKSLITLKGTLSPQDQYLKKFPLLSSLLSPDKTFSYQGTLSGIISF